MAKKESKSNNKIVNQLNEILEMEISGVARYLHYSLMIRGPNRIPIVKFFRDQATEAFMHAAQIGEKITAYGGHPSLKVASVPETNKHSTLEVLTESLEFEKEGLDMYKKLLKVVGTDVALEEMTREFIRLETEHIEEVEKMLDVGR